MSSDDAVANAVGSNIFDLCLCLGFPVFLYVLLNGPIEMSGSAGVSELRFVLLILTALVVFCLTVPKRVGYSTVAIFMSGYAFYATYAFASGMNAEWASALSEKLSFCLSCLQ